MYRYKGKVVDITPRGEHGTWYNEMSPLKRLRDLLLQSYRTEDHQVYIQFEA